MWRCISRLLINFCSDDGAANQTIAIIAGINIGLNTLNNIGTSFFNPNFYNDMPLNTGKIVTGVLGAGIGIVGGNVVGNLYGNGMDAYLNDVNDKYYNR